MSDHQTTGGFPTFDVLDEIERTHAKAREAHLRTLSASAYTPEPVRGLRAWLRRLFGGRS